MLTNVLNAVLGSTTKVQILRALLPLVSPVSGREAQRLAGIRSDQGVRAALGELSDLEILHRIQTRRAYLYQINREHELATPLAALFEAETGRVRTLRDTLREGIERAGLLGQVRSVVLFGSNARGDARPASDLDLLVVTDGEDAVDPVRDTLLVTDDLIRHRLGLRISPYVLPRDRVQERYQDGDPLMTSVEAEGRTLFGASFSEVANPW